MKAEDFDKLIDDGKDVSNAVDWSTALRPNSTGTLPAPPADPRRSLMTAELPDDLKALVLEALEHPYEP